MLRWVLIGVLILVVLLVTVALVGWCLPKGHHASRSVVLSAPPDAVFRVVADVAHAASWRSDVTRIEAIAGSGVGMTFREVGSNGSVAYRVEAFEPSRRLVTRIADRTLPYGGTWTFDIQAVDGGTRLTISEDGEVYNPIFRFMSRFVFSQTASIERYQADLARKIAD